MNKFFRGALLLCAMFAAVVMAGCKTDTPTPTPEPTESGVQFTIEELEYDSVAVTITPSTNDAVYYAFLYPDTEEFFDRDPEEVYIDIR